ncbi:MAG TPA: NAD+ kinase [Polyangia bacterium]
MFAKVVVVVRKTRLEELIERFNTRGQAKFYLEHAGGDFGEYEAEHDAYQRALERVRRGLDLGLQVQVIGRELVPSFSFTPQDLVVTLGQDGLVANTAKYVGGQPIVAVNPDPARFDGVLLPFLPAAARAAAGAVLAGRARVREVTMAEIRLNDGQRLLGFNDLFIGARTHVSARYRIRFAGAVEPQSSSGVLVSTGAGSTGWLSSVFTMAAGVAALAGGQGGHALQLGWEDRRLVFVVREPFVSKHSRAGIVAGLVEPSDSVVLESLMPAGGVVFSDGMEADYLEFNAGAIAIVRGAEQRARLVVGAA